jgi:hypothetical protein
MPQTIWRKNEQHLIENFELAAADNFVGWHLHHRLELTLDGHNAASCNDLKRLRMYWRRPYFELIYLRQEDHIAMHNRANALDGKYCSQQRIDRISRAVRLAYEEGRIDVSGERNGMFGKHSWNAGKKLPPLSEEVRAKLSQAHRGCTPWNKGKALTEDHKQKLSEANRKPKSEHMRKALSEARKEYWKKHPISKELIAKMAAGRIGKKRGPYKKTWTTWYVGPDGKRVYV